MAFEKLQQAVKDKQSQETLSNIRTQVRTAHQKFTLLLSHLRQKKSVHDLQNFTFNHIVDKNAENLNVWKHIKKINQNNNPTKSLPKRMKNLAGIWQKSDQESAQCWHESRQYISAEHDSSSSLFRKSLWENLTARERQLITENNTCDPLNLLPFNKNITAEEIESVIKTLRTGVNPGQDNIHNILLTQGKTEIVVLLQATFEALWKLEKHPEAWDFCRMRMIYKKGDIHLAKNYRGIVLISTLCKIYEAIIKNRMQKHIIEHRAISPLQHGYQAQTSTTEAVYTLTQLIQRRHHHEKKATYCAFIDFVTAFPSVCRPSLWDAVHARGISGKTWRVLHDLYAKPSCQVIHPLMHDYFDIKKGIREGSKLSPLLYTIFIDTLVAELQASNLGVSVNGHLNHIPYSQWMGMLLYADDIVLIADNAAQLQQMLDMVQSWSQNHHATISIEKTYTMVFHGQNSIAENTDTLTWSLTNTSSDSPVITTLKTCKTFTYLGVLLDQRLTFEAARKQITSSFWFAHRKIQQYGAHSAGFSPQITATLWRSMVLSKLTNTLPFIYNPRDIQAIQSIINRSIKHLVAPHANQKAFMPVPALLDLGIPSAAVVLAQLLARFYVHLQTIPTHRPASILHRLQKQILTGDQYSPGLFPQSDPTQPAEYFDTSMKKVLSTLHLQSEWASVSLPFTRSASPKSIEKSWMHKYIRPALLVLQREELNTWARSPKHATRLSRGRTYLHFAASTHFKGTDDIWRKDVFAVAPYLIHSHSSLAAMNLLRLRTQTSSLPAHQPFPNDSQSPNPFFYIPYEHRYCLHCCPPQHAWGLRHPGTDFPIGNEQHLCTSCPTHTDTMLTCTKALDTILKKLPHKLDDINYPWAALSEEEKIATLLGAPPPSSWGLPVASMKKWMEQSSPVIYEFWKPILQHCTQALKDQDGIQLPFLPNSLAAAPI